jgi:hypothetical protein
MLTTSIFYFRNFLDMSPLQSAIPDPRSPGLPGAPEKNRPSVNSECSNCLSAYRISDYFDSFPSLIVSLLYRGYRCILIFGWRGGPSIKRKGRYYSFFIYYLNVLRVLPRSGALPHGSSVMLSGKTGVPAGNKRFSGEKAFPLRSVSPEKHRFSPEAPAFFRRRLLTFSGVI